MESLVNDSAFFLQATSLDCAHVDLSWAAEKTTAENVLMTTKHLLGDKFKFQDVPLEMFREETEFAIYNILTQLLPPLCAQSSHFWRKLGRPFASMLSTAGYLPSAQCRFLTFVYARVLGMMGPDRPCGYKSLMTLDASPAELSWVIPKKRARSGDINRDVRFAIEPLHPISGISLRGSAVLDYLVSPNGSLGVIKCDEDGLSWRKATENFLFPDDGQGREIPEGSRFFVGFDFTASGTALLKAYYLPSPNPTHPLPIRSTRSKIKSSINLWDTDYSPLRILLSQLDPGLERPLESLLSYFEDMDDRYKHRVQILSVDCITGKKNRLKIYCRPKEGTSWSEHRVQILSVDCITGKKNRLKIYCRPKEGTSWSDAKRSFTLAGRLNSPNMEAALARMESLWNNLFPEASSLNNQSLRFLGDVFDDGVNGNGIKLSTNSHHPIGGLLFYYSLTAGEEAVHPKIYLPVSLYCPNDLFITQAIEKFYDDESVGIKNPEVRDNTEGWVTREVACAYNHRPLAQKAGLHTYITFGIKSDGWDVTSYFSPEVWE